MVILQASGEASQYESSQNKDNSPRSPELDLRQKALLQWNCQGLPPKTAGALITKETTRAVSSARMFLMRSTVQFDPISRHPGRMEMPWESSRIIKSAVFISSIFLDCRVLKLFRTLVISIWFELFIYIFTTQTTYDPFQSTLLKAFFF